MQLDAMVYELTRTRTAIVSGNKGQNCKSSQSQTFTNDVGRGPYYQHLFTSPCFLLSYVSQFLGMTFNSPEILSAQNENKDNLTKESRGGKDDQFNNNKRLKGTVWYVLLDV